MIFNLAETIYNKGEFAYLAPSVLSYIGIPYTGNPVVPMFISSNKLLSKKELKSLGIPTPKYIELEYLKYLPYLPDEKYILKPIWEEGSFDLDEHSIFRGNDSEFLQKIRKEKNKDYYFIEEFIDGREFNVSIIGTEDGPQVLPIAEMTFDYPDGKPKIMGYRAKWDENSYEYTHTVRTFDVHDEELKNKIVEICERCWSEFGFKGYVRIDFRVDSNNEPYVIDMNLNPCISESGGFMAACLEYGYTINEVIEMILKEATR